MQRTQTGNFTLGEYETTLKVKGNNAFGQHADDIMSAVVGFIQTCLVAALRHEIESHDQSVPHAHETTDKIIVTALGIRCRLTVRIKLDVYVDPAVVNRLLQQHVMTYAIICVTQSIREANGSSARSLLTEIVELWTAGQPDLMSHMTHQRGFDPLLDLAGSVFKTQRREHGPFMSHPSHHGNGDHTNLAGAGFGPMYGQ